jgi:hypothetical protein
MPKKQRQPNMLDEIPNLPQAEREQFSAHPYPRNMADMPPDYHQPLKMEGIKKRSGLGRSKLPLASLLHK